MDITRFRDIVDYASTGSLLAGSDMHGDAHWRAAAAQAIHLADTLGLGLHGRQIGLLFGLFHDCRRENEDHDPQHGARAADHLAKCDLIPSLGAGNRARLSYSLIFHDSGKTSDDRIIGLGWDADRSLLTRCGMRPDHRFFSCLSAENLPAFVDRGRTLNDEAPAWDELWRMTFEM